MPAGRPFPGAMAAGPVGIWLALQLGALALAAWRVPLAAQYPQPGEFQAVRVVLAAQFAGVALLFPSLVPSVRMLLVAISAGWVMLVAAAALAAWPLVEIVPAGTFLTSWILVLATIRAATPPAGHMIASALACLYIVGGPLVAYFHQEFAGSALAHPDWAFGPLIAAISTPHHLPPLAWAEAGGLEILAVFTLAIRQKTANRPPLSSTRPS